MNKNKVKGVTTELRVMSAFVELGYSVSTPCGDCEQYDFIADVNGKLLRVQCKTAVSYDNGRSIDIDFRRKDWTAPGKSKHTYYDKERVDIAATYFKGKTYLVPAEEIIGKIRLRFDFPKTGQKSGFNMASDYEIQKVIKRMEV